jgi:hypothetical protein
MPLIASDSARIVPTRFLFLLALLFGIVAGNVSAQTFAPAFSHPLSATQPVPRGGK